MVEIVGIVVLLIALLFGFSALFHAVQATKCPKCNKRAMFKSRFYTNRHGKTFHILVCDKCGNVKRLESDKNI